MIFYLIINHKKHISKAETLKELKELIIKRFSDKVTCNFSIEYKDDINSL